MFHFVLYFKPLLKSHVFVASFVTFLGLNLIENLYHYTIGRESGKNGLTTKNLKIDLPSQEDWIRIISVMIIFGLLQAGLTCFLGGC